MPHIASQHTHRIENHMCTGLQLFWMCFVTSSVNITQMQVEKYRNNKAQLPLTWSLFMVTFVIFFFFFLTREAPLKDAVACTVSRTRPRASGYRCDLLRLRSLSPPAASHLTPPSSPFHFPRCQEWCHRAMMGHKSKSSLSRSWELSWVYFYGFFISLLPPPACVPACQGTDSWPKARSTGIHPRPRCSFEVSPRSDNKKKKVMVVAQDNNKFKISHINHQALLNMSLKKWIWGCISWSCLESSIFIVFVCVCICISWFCKLTRGCSGIDLSEQLKEDFCRICGPSDIINCTVGLRQRFLQSNSRVHPVLAVSPPIACLISGQAPPAFPAASPSSSD